MLLPSATSAIARVSRHNGTVCVSFNDGCGPPLFVKNLDLVFFRRDCRGCIVHTLLETSLCPAGIALESAINDMDKPEDHHCLCYRIINDLEWLLRDCRTPRIRRGKVIPILRSEWSQSLHPELLFHFRINLLLYFFANVEFHCIALSSAVESEALLADYSGLNDALVHAEVLTLNANPYASRAFHSFLA